MRGVVLQKQNRGECKMSVQTPSVFACGESTSLVNEGGKGSYAKFPFIIPCLPCEILGVEKIVGLHYNV